MKKIFFIIIVTYLLLSGVLYFVFKNQKQDEVKILSLMKDYSRVITKGEVIDIPVYINSDTSFLTSLDNITKSRIISDLDETEINISRIRKTNTVRNYEGEAFYLYYFAIDFSSVYTDKLTLKLEKAVINVLFVNDVNLELKIGDMFLTFDNLEQTSLIDFTRMYSIHNNGAISGLYIEITNDGESPIEITSIDLLNPNIMVDMNTIEVVSEPPYYLGDMEVLVDGYDMVIEERKSQKSYLLTRNQTLILPINHLDNLNYIDRFPLIFTYIYENVSYQYLIDDYIFYETETDLENSRYDIDINQYKYQ